MQKYPAYENHGKTERDNVMSPGLVILTERFGTQLKTIRANKNILSWRHSNEKCAI